MIKRTITAIGLILILIMMLTFFPSWVFVIFVEMLLLIGVYEWCLLGKMSELKQGMTMLLYIILTLPSIMGFMGYFDNIRTMQSIHQWEQVILHVGLLFWIIAVPFLLKIKYKVAYRWSGVMIGALIMSSALIAVGYLLSRSISLLVIGIFIPVIADIFAFISGKLFGQVRLTVISPQKTMEGLFVGVVCATIVGGVLLHTAIKIPWGMSFIMVFVVACVSVFGDLLESLAKRWAQKKDSGKLLPGHGGILDRFDSHISVLPVFGAFLTWL